MTVVVDTPTPPPHDWGRSPAGNQGSIVPDPQFERLPLSGGGGVGVSAKNSSFRRVTP
jgi:hypothetical protein